MKARLLAVPFALALVLSPAAQAQSVSCPDLYPRADVSLPAAADDPAGIGFVTRGRLTFAYVHFGELRSAETLVPDAPTKVKGGWYTDYAIHAGVDNWLVCKYGGSSWGGGDIERWEKLSPSFKSCRLNVRETKTRPYPTAWKAAATCQ